jgi:hypothetical protein
MPPQRLLAAFLGLLVAAIVLSVAWRMSQGRPGGISLKPSTTALGEKIWLDVQHFSPPIWFKGAEIVQGASDLPWIPAARAGIIQPGVPYEHILPFVTESFLMEDFSREAYQKGQRALLGRKSRSDRSVFYAVDVRTKTAHFLIVVGWSLQLLNEPTSEYPPTARLYEMQHGKWLITSTKRNSDVLSLPWNNLGEIEAMIKSGSAFRDDRGGWRAGFQ